MTANTMTPESSSTEKPAKDKLEELPGELASPSAAPLVNWGAVGPVDVVTLAVVAAVLGWSYAPNIASLVRTWNREPDYSHGFLVVPIALVILWKTWPTGPDLAPRAWLPGWLLVMGGLGLRYQFHEQGSNWSESATLFLVIAGLGLARLGWRCLSRTWPAFAFLIFLFPLPPQLNTALSQPLQSLATWCACSLLRLTGLWVMPEGNVIMVGNERLEVAAACNGLSMLMSLAATVAATASLVPMANWKRIILLPSIIPIALGSNILRITATAWCYHKFGAEVGSKYAHDAAGWLMMPTAMALVGLELALMSWLIVESEESGLRENRLVLERSTSPSAFEGRL
jgi:exosortase